MVKTKKIVFFGTPEFSIPSLEAILDSGRSVPLVITQPDRPAGRGQKPTPSPVKKFCKERGIDISQPTRLKEKSFLDRLRFSKSHYFVVVAYGRILPQELLEIPTLILNVHASLLPRWRGVAPIERAIINGDRQSGVSIMKIVQELDAGDEQRNQ